MAVKVIYMTLALLLVTAQLGTGKSVDNAYRLKRQEADQVATTIVAASTSSSSTTTTDDDQETTTVVPTTIDSTDSEVTTTLKPDEDPITVRPLAKEDKSGKKSKKPISERIGEDDEDDVAGVSPSTPATGKGISKSPVASSNADRDTNPPMSPPAPHDQYYFYYPAVETGFINTIKNHPPQAQHHPLDQSSYDNYNYYHHPNVIIANDQSPEPYFYPHPSGPAFSEGGNFAASVASSSSGPQGGHVFAASYPGPGGKPVVQSSSWPGPGGAAVNAIGNGPNNAASASASNGAGGQKPLAGGKPLVPNFTGGVNGNSASASASFGDRINTGANTGGNNGVKVQTSPNSVSVSSSASAGGNGVNSIGIRGSFGEDGDSVGIEVNGEQVPVPNGPQGAIPLPASAAYPAAGGNNNAFAGASAGASAGGAVAGGQGQRLPPQQVYNGPNPAELFAQYFAALQAQQLAFQRQLQAQIAAQQNANSGAAGFGGGGGVGGSYATGGAFITNSRGEVDPQARAYVSTYSSPNSASASSSTSLNGGGGGGSTWSSASLYPRHSPSPAAPSTLANNNNIDSVFNSFWGVSPFQVDSYSVAPPAYDYYTSNSYPHVGLPEYSSYSYAPPMSFGPGGFGSAGQFPAGYPSFGVPPPGFPAGFPAGFPTGPQVGGAAQSATASASIGPGGGYQQAAVNPPNPNFASRFGETIPASPGGGSYGVFSSSSSSSGVGPDGKPVNHKQATVAVNNNGKVSVHTVGDP